MPPARDDKVLADWNGLAIAGLAVAFARTGRSRYLELAEELFARVTAALGEGDRLFHAWRDGRRSAQSFLEDYAQMIRAALLLHQCTAAASCVETARRWTATVESAFRGADGVLHPVPPAASELPLLPLAALDGPVPSGVATQAENLARLFLITGDPEYRHLAERTIEAFAGQLAENPYGHAGLLSASLVLEKAVQIRLHGRAGDPAWSALRDAALRKAPPAHLLVPQAQEGEEAFATVCVGSLCQPPARSVEELTRLLRPD